MALSTDEQTQMLALMAREGGLSTLAAELSALSQQAARAAAIGQLNKVINVTITDWTAIATFVNTGSPLPQDDVLNAIAMAVVSRDQSLIGPLLIHLYMNSRK